MTLKASFNGKESLQKKKSCCEKRHRVKGAWSKVEDQKLIDYIGKHGEGRWRSLPQAAGLLRCGKSCRLWVNYLKPELKRGNFGEDEEDLIIKLHALLGNRWSLIAGRLPGRTDNEVKNYWNTHLSRKLEKTGVDMSKHNRMQQAHSSQKREKTRSSSLVKNDECKTEEESSKEDTESSTSGSVTGGGSSISILPDLNLDLNLMTLPVIEEKKQGILDPAHHPIEETMAFHKNADSSPLLLLFR